ncbi:hypothetical protein [Pseudomonas segetis]|uniref:SMI1-KNR4 cell-wall n=1 Tax=Pseudomonas segetis TaxID=298908 RepID=A0A239DAJ0_9PSED|nr:hypothetical protein [Pseudomonas segetis]SNS29132.1 hypothetical protein SAMN05216255_2151 [Pseudomonas segetis]
MSSWYLFDEAMLPEGFKFPISFLEFTCQKILPDLEPWWFLCKYKSNADFWLEELKRLYPARSLVPFAKLEDSDDFACFDGSEDTDNLAVFFIHAYASSGWEERGRVANFSDWLEVAKMDSARYKQERAED